MAKNRLHKAFTRNQELAKLVAEFAAASGAKVWVEDIHGALLFGLPQNLPVNKVEIAALGEVLGYVCGCEKAPLVGAWLSQWATQEAMQRKLGAETLHLYREVNFMFGFSEKLAAVRGMEAIAHLALEEVGRLIRFEQGAIIYQPEPTEPIRIIALSGEPFDPAWLLAQIPTDGSSEIVDLAGKGLDKWAMLASLKVNYRILGSVLLLRRINEEFSAEDLKLLTSLALQTAAALENALQYEAAAEKAFELQREKLENENLLKLDELKSRFFSNITHEFRTPLTVILGMASLPGSQIPNELEERFEMIRRNGADMLRLVDQLLDLAKLETQSIQLQFIRADIMIFLRQMVEPFQLFAAEREISFEFQSATESRIMDFDPDKLKQILSNLISNAIKFTPPGGRIYLVAEWAPPPSPKLVLSIADTGAGIPEEDLTKIFDRFFQSAPSPSQAHPGSGIGLSHARELARLMGGDITVQSRLGVGTSFSLWLPAPGLPHPLSEPVAESGTLSLPAGEHPLLLLIEDNPDLVRYLQACLQPHYQIEVARDGASGIARALDLIPDIIISDVMMPGADGFEVCDTLKADQRTSHIPIILLTAKADAQSRLTGLRHGADAYLGKPFDLEELLVRLENLLELRAKLQQHYSQTAISGNRAAKNTQAEDAFIENLKNILEENLSDENFALPDLCRAIGMSRSQLFRKMKALINQAPSSFIRMYRLHRAKALLEKTDLPVSEIAYQVGFKDPAYFSFAFHEAFGQPPRSVRS